jgi:hypothetical protein
MDDDDLPMAFDGYTQRLRSITEACIALSQIKDPPARKHLSKAIAAMTYHMDAPKGVLHDAKARFEERAASDT